MAAANVKVKVVSSTKKAKVKTFANAIAQALKCIDYDVPPAFPCDKERVVFIGMTIKDAPDDKLRLFCRELTKRHETAFQTTIEDLIHYYEAEKPLGECVLVLEGRSHEELRAEEQASWESISIEEHMAIYESKGLSNKDAMKQVAKDRGVTKREIYQYLLDKKEQ